MKNNNKALPDHRDRLLDPEYLRSVKPKDTSCWPHHHFVQVNEPQDPLQIRRITAVRLFCTQCGTVKELSA